MLAVLAAVGLAGAPATAAPSSSLYSGGGPRPGPSILYQPPVVAPELTNAPGSAWKAAPILVSGSSAYRSGEYLYQDYLYDDHGAAGTVRDPNDPRTAGDLFSAPDGTYTYPTGPGYNGDAADLVEFRVRPLADATAFRVTLNTLVDPSLPAFTVAIGTPGSAVAAYPHGAQSTGPADLFVTVHNHYADLARAGSATVTALPSPAIDMTRRQIEVLVPHSDWNPGGGTVRLSLGVGLWDKSTPDAAQGRYLIPGVSATATQPGGLGLLQSGSASAFFNVAFRHTEPGGQANTDPNGNNRRWWRDEAQGQALKTGDMSAFHDDVNFDRLKNGVSDDMNQLPQGVPLTGSMDRILSSHFETEQGTDYSTTCGGNAGCKGELRGQLQPYNIYVPSKPPPASGYGMTLLLHSLSANYNQYLFTQNQSEFGERGTGSIVITPSGRGPDGWYVEYAGADTFEVWADVASRYHLDPAFTAITGYSMGGYGTFRLGALYPDLFYKAQPTVGPPGVGIWVPPNDPTGGADSNSFPMLPSFRNLPIMMWVMHTDELVPFAGTEYQAHQGFDALGLRYEFLAFAPGEHLTLAINDQFQPAADWLGQGQVDRNPAHVTYVVNPHMTFPGIGLEADHSYWLSGLALRNSTGGNPLGTIDVRSEGFGVADATPSGTQAGAGALTGGTLPAIAYERQFQDWGSTPSAPVADVLHIHATNISSVTIDPRRARVSCGAKLDIQSDGPLQVQLAGCGGGVHAAESVSGDSSAPLSGSLPLTAIASPWPRRLGLVAAIAAIGLLALFGAAWVRRRDT
ncbi:MAG TPA: hypothetical protein VNV65_09505 [Candidatus Solibacter sp.]|nr:hypothetical protein [Candidatus Solibacter sp.]